MKYWRGYIVAAALLLLTWGMVELAKAHGELVDMVYPYTSRLIQDVLANWSASVPFCLWQLLAVFLIVVLLVTIILMILLRWNFVQWLGWIMAGVCLL